MIEIDKLIVLHVAPSFVLVEVSWVVRDDPAAASTR